MSSSEVKGVKAINEARASFMIDELEVNNELMYKTFEKINKNCHTLKRVRWKNENGNGQTLGCLFLPKYKCAKK